MVSSVASLKHLSAGRWPVASVRPTPASHSETTQKKAEEARNGRGAENRVENASGRVVDGKAELSSAAMAALLRVQEQRATSDIFDRLEDVLGGVLERLADRWERKKPKPPKPHDPPPSPPVVQPPPVAVVDDPAPVRYLEGVLERLRAPSPSAPPELPFSQRAENRRKPATPAPPAGLGAFYTPGVFTQAQAGAMRTVAQGQAGLALLQAAAYARPLANPFRINTFA